MEKRLTSLQMLNVRRRVMRCVRELREEGVRVSHRDVWVALNAHFGVEKYSELREAQFQEAMRFLNKLAYQRKNPLQEQ